MIEHFPGDKSTIFSIVPMQIGPEYKPGIYPGAFTIPPCLDDSRPERLVVGASEHLSHIGGRSEPLRQITPSYSIAKSIVDDYLDAQMWTGEDARPGLCWVAGDISLSIFLSKHQDIFSRIRANQRSWYQRVVQQTEDEWQRYHTHKVVSAQARIAARFLGLEPDWIRAETNAMQALKCPACSTPNDPVNAVCTNCRCVLNKTKYESLSFAK